VIRRYQMPAQQGIGDVTQLLPNVSEKIEEIKKQSRLRQALGAVVLFGSAALAVWVGPTTAIVVAALAVAAVWLLPPARRRFLGDSVVLRDSTGRIRLTAGLSDDGLPLMALQDTSDQLRFILGLGDGGSPLLALFDDVGKGRLSITCSAKGAALTLWDPAGEKARAGLWGGDADDPAMLALGDLRGGYTTLNEWGIDCVRGDQRARLLTTDEHNAVMDCRYGADSVTCFAREDTAAMIVENREQRLVVDAANVTVDDDNLGDA
jgi:hypothetical protein